MALQAGALFRLVEYDRAPRATWFETRGVAALLTMRV